VIKIEFNLQDPGNSAIETIDIFRHVNYTYSLSTNSILPDDVGLSLSYTCFKGRICHLWRKLRYTVFNRFLSIDDSSLLEMT